MIAVWQCEQLGDRVKAMCGFVNRLVSKGEEKGVE